MVKFIKGLMIAGLIAAILNMSFLFFDQNFSGALGWMVALCWYPYEKVFGTQSKSNTHKEKKK